MASPWHAVVRMSTTQLVLLFGESRALMDSMHFISSSIKVCYDPLLTTGADQKIHKERAESPASLPPSRKKFHFSGLAAYSIVGVFAMKSKVTLTCQKHFENTRKKGGAAPSAPPLNQPMNNIHCAHLVDTPAINLWFLVMRNWENQIIRE